jgi:hypothetical protein
MPGTKTITVRFRYTTSVRTRLGNGTELRLEYQANEVFEGIPTAKVSQHELGLFEVFDFLLPDDSLLFCVPYWAVEIL